MLNTLFLPEIREMLAEGNGEALREFCTTIHPASVAEFMSGLTADEAWEVLSFADVHERTEIFLYFEPDRQVEIIERQDRRESADLIQKMAPDDRVDLLEFVDEAIVNELLALLPQEDRRDILRLRAHPENTAGAVMTTAVAKFPEAMTVRDALELSLIHI